MATGNNQYQNMVKVLLAASTIEALASAINNGEIIAIDAKAAYTQANSGKLGNEAKALSAIFKHIASLYENTGKNAGISTVYNVIDARQVRGIKFTKKLAYNLQGSKYLAQFVALTTSVIRNEATKNCISVNGKIFAQNRNAYHTETLNSNAKVVKVKKAQFANEAKAIASGNASSITSKPTSAKGKKLAQIANQLISGIVKPLAIEYHASATNE